MTSTPKILGASCCIAWLRAAPPVNNTRFALCPMAFSTASMASSIEHSKPSTTPRAKSSRVVSVRRPVSNPLACGRLGVRSPSKYGNSVTEELPASAISESPRWSTPKRLAAKSSTFAPFNVHASGKYAPVASAKPVTKPFSSCTLSLLQALATPEVPTDTHTSPGCNSKPRAAAILSPVPAAIAAPEEVRPTISLGSAIRGSLTLWPKNCSANSGKKRRSRVE